MTLPARGPTIRRCSSFRPSTEAPASRTDTPSPGPENARQIVLQLTFTTPKPADAALSFDRDRRFGEFRGARLRTQRRYQHQLNEHLEHVRPKIHTRCVGKVLVYVTKGTSGSEERVDRLVQAARRQTILLRGQLGVQGGCVEQDRSFLECDGSLTARHASQRIEPLEIDAQAAIGREESSLDEVQLIVVAQQQRDPRCVSGRRSRCLCFFFSNSKKKIVEDSRRSDTFQIVLDRPI